MVFQRLACSAPHRWDNAASAASDREAGRAERKAGAGLAKRRASLVLKKTSIRINWSAACVGLARAGHRCDPPMQTKRSALDPLIRRENARHQLRCNCRPS